MDEMLIFRKMESLGRCVNRIRSKRGFTYEELLRDFDLQDILSVNIQRAVQLSEDIALHILSDLSGTLPDTMGQAFPRFMNMESFQTARPMPFAAALACAISRCMIMWL